MERLSRGLAAKPGHGGAQAAVPLFAETQSTGRWLRGSQLMVPTH